MDIPEDDHVMRHISYSRLLKDEQGNVENMNGKPYGILPQAFELREADGNKLSVNWVEYFKKSTHLERLKDTINEIRRVRDIPVRSRCGYGVGNVKKIKEVSSSNGFDQVKVVYAKTKDNPSHSSIIRLPNNDDNLMQAFANDAFIELVLNEEEQLKN